MQQIGLYYPYVHVRDDTWLKAAALYLPKLGRIVPEGFLLNDRETLRALSNECDFIVDVDPREAVTAAAHLFTGAIQGNESSLRHRFAATMDIPYGSLIVNSDPTLTAGQVSHRAAHLAPLAAIHRGELDPGLTSLLIDEGLVHPRPRIAAPGEHSDHWVGVDPAFAWVYKCVLTAELAKRTAYVPVTDQVVAHGTSDDWTGERITAALLGREPLQTGLDTETRLGLMAVQCVLPANLDAVPVEKIIKLRRNHAEEFSAFAAGVGAAATAIRERTAHVTDRTAFENHLQLSFDENIAQPLGRLRAAMTGLNLQTVFSAFNIKSETFAAATAASGLFGGSTTIAAGGLAIGTATWRHETAKARDAAMAASPVGYLLRVEQDLKPATLLDRVKRAAARAAGTGV
ncbi:DUF6236 family protein [Kitasatospora sp. NPDC001664]